jgi:hypothetical protein
MEEDLAGASGALYSLFITQRRQERRGAKEKKRAYVRKIIVILSRFFLFIKIWLTITLSLFPLFFPWP